MPWKMKDNHIEFDASNNPVWIGDDGKEIAINGGEVLTKINTLNTEAASHRRAKETAERDLQKFAGIDPEKAKEALDTVSKIDQKQLIDAGKVEEVRNQVKTQFQAQLDAEKATNAKLTDSIKAEKLANAFSNSKYLKEKLVLPIDVAQKFFGEKFDVDIEKNFVGAKDVNGNPIYSTKKPGDPAGFDELLETFVEAYPNKASILKGANHTGTGNNGGGGNDGTKRTVTRSEEAKMSPADRKALMTAIKAGTAELVSDH